MRRYIEISGRRRVNVSEAAAQTAEKRRSG
jgi:hypothetical protein